MGKEIAFFSFITRKVDVYVFQASVSSKHT